MPLLFTQITSAPNVNSNEFVDIPQLFIDLPPASAELRQALIILNVPQPFAEGNDTPGLDFAINVEGKVVATGGFTYPMTQPQSFARVPFTLVVRVNLRNDGQQSHVHAQWRSVRSSTGHIDSFASISAVLDSNY